MDEPQIIKSPSGDELVVMSLEDYDALVEALAEAHEELEDIAALDRRKAEDGVASIASLPVEVSVFLMQGHRRVAAIRLWRGLTTQVLAVRLGISETEQARIEAGNLPVDAVLASKFAAALGMPETWIEARLLPWPSAHAPDRPLSIARISERRSHAGELWIVWTKGTHHGHAL